MQSSTMVLNTDPLCSPMFTGGASASWRPLKRRGRPEPLPERRGCDEQLLRIVNAKLNSVIFPLNGTSSYLAGGGISPKATHRHADILPGAIGDVGSGDVRPLNRRKTFNGGGGRLEFMSVEYYRVLNKSQTLPKRCKWRLVGI